MEGPYLRSGHCSQMPSSREAFRETFVVTVSGFSVEEVAKRTMSPGECISKNAIAQTCGIGLRNSRCCTP